MPLHKPIRFREPELPEYFKMWVENFAKEHPVASSTIKAVAALAILGGVIAVTSTAPGLLTAFKRKPLKYVHEEKKKRYQKLWRGFHELRKRKVVEYKGEDKDGYSVYQISDGGKQYVKKFVLETLNIAAPKKWDRKWRIITFDVPEKKFKNHRRAFQQKLKELGFYQIQKSVWIHPFPCETEIEFLKDIFQIQPFVEIFLTDKITNGRTIYHFKELLQNYA